MDANRLYKKALEHGNTKEAQRIQNMIKEDDLMNSQKHSRTALMYLFSHFTWPVVFYFIYMYCGNILQETCGYSATDVIKHNLLLSIFQLFISSSYTVLYFFVYPLTLIRWLLFLFVPFLLLSPFFMDVIQNGYFLPYITKGYQILFFQVIFLSFAAHLSPPVGIVFAHFPVLKRFTYASMPYALSRAIMYPIASFGMVASIRYFGSYFGFWLIFIPVIVLFIISFQYFVKLEKESGNYPGFIKNLKN